MEKIKEFWQKIKNRWVMANNWQKVGMVLLLVSVLFIKIIIKILILKFCCGLWGYFWHNFSKAGFYNQLIIIKNGLWILGGTLGFWFAFRRLQIADKNQKTEQTKELHERYARAVELLSNDDDAVRMGALYSLKQIAEENDGEFFEQCKEIIAGYVRNQLHKRSQDSNRSEKLAEDIKTSINILSTIAESKFFKDKFVNLQGISLENTDLSKSDIMFNKLDFSFSKFDGLKFKHNTNLSTCNFFNCNLKNAKMTGVKLQNANLDLSRLQDSDLAGADLSGAKMSAVNFRGVTLSNTKLDSVNLRWALIKDILFFSSNLKNSNCGELYCDKAFFDLHVDKNDYKFIFLKDYVAQNPDYISHLSFLYPTEELLSIDDIGVLLRKVVVDFQDSESSSE